MTLEEIRKEIDSIDEQLLSLFERRMRAAVEVAKIKQKTGQPVFNAKREEEVLSHVGEAAGKLGSSARIVFQTMMDVSRSLQHNILGGGAPLKDLVEQATRDSIDLLHGARVACYGESGSYSHAAATQMFQDPALSFCPQFGNVFDAIQNGDADYGVIPVENSTAGSVTEVYDLLIRHRFYIISAVKMPIDHCLCAPKGASLDTIQKVYSHPQALRQCSSFLASLGAEPIQYASTSTAAKTVAQWKDVTKAAIASKDAAKQYGCVILKDCIQNQKNNCTRFVAVSRKLHIEPSANKISLVFSIPHTTGSLYRVLANFAALGFNLTKIESRPIQESRFEYYFYLDFLGNAVGEDTLHLLRWLSEELPYFAFLGNYPEQTSGANGETPEAS